MPPPRLTLRRLTRRHSDGLLEELTFEPGVNLLVGRPNTGKTKWLQTLDYLLGDPGENPFAGDEKDGLDQKYDAALADFVIDGQPRSVERRWREAGAKTKLFVDGDAHSPSAFQQFLLRSLGIPVLHFPKGNPTSGQTWPELSFRMLLRHMHRQQRFWGALADQQPDNEQHACVLQFLGLAERIFTEDYGRLVDLKMQAERLAARRDQHSQTLDDIAREVLAEPGMSIGVNDTTVREAELRLTNDIDTRRQQRLALLTGARDAAIPPNHGEKVRRDTEERASLLVALDGLKQKAEAATARLEEIRRYRAGLADELDRLTRAEDAGDILADLRVTHCPACDQLVQLADPVEPGRCALCHQDVLDELPVDGLGVARLRFERDRLSGEFKEAEELVAVLQADTKRLSSDIRLAEERIRMLDNALAPSREAVGALVQEDVSAIDMALGELSERQRHLGRIKASLDQRRDLTERIRLVESEIEPLQAQVDERARATDFEAAAARLEDGMNAYFGAINTLRPGTWNHSPVKVELSRWRFTIRVGPRRWQSALGGTDTLYFLMAYHYGLLSLTAIDGCHYPGFAIIDVPGEFAGEAVEDKENFIIRPFIELLARDENSAAQLIVTGASFAGLEGAHRLQLNHVYTA